jgi:F-type H+-transporting ATPase subunit b
MNPSLLLVVGEAPLIDLDWTFLVQAGLFLAVMAIATPLLFRPFLRMREQRSEGIEGARAEAERLSAEAGTRLADYESRLAQARARTQEERRGIRSEAIERQTQITQKARDEATSTFATARERIAKETEAARQELMPRAADLATQMASKLLGREVSS